MSSSRDHGERESFSDDDDDDEQREIEMSETRPLLSSRRTRVQSSITSKKSTRSTTNRLLNDLNRREGFVEIDPATGGRIPHDLLLDRTDGDIVLQTFQSNESLPIEQSSNFDPENSTTTQTQQFVAELQQKAKLIKLGISFICKHLRFSG